MSEEFDKEKLNDTDTSSFVPQDAEAQADYEDGMKVKRKRMTTIRTRLLSLCRSLRKRK